ncbi:BREX-1 system adenine-specific DNA-methyltransferase PglX [Lacticaseibacillus saniviri]
MTQIPEADFDIASDDSQGQVEIIGWLYQYYNQEEKDAVISTPTSHKFRGTEIASATQIFTPNWIVKYMVQNSLGKTWIKVLLQREPKKSEQEFAHEFGWDYYMEDVEQLKEVNETIRNIDKASANLGPEDLTLFDPSMGSGHILVYAFDILMQIYQSEGFSQREAAQLIVQKNLIGLDIDKRAFQLTYFSIMMKFRQYHRRALGLSVVPEVYHISNSKELTDDTINFAFTSASTQEGIIQLRDAFINADMIGSLIDVESIETQEIQLAIDAANQTSDLLSLRGIQIVNNLNRVATILQKHYQTVVTNPPYMGSSRMDKDLSKFTKNKYPMAKADLFAMFLEHFSFKLKKGGYLAMVTMQSWMFLSSFRDLRHEILKRRMISNLMHMENNVMGIAFGTAVTILRNASITGFIGTYHQIKSQDVSNGNIPTDLPIPGNRFNRTNQTNFEKIPGSPIAYWASENLIHDFEVGTPMSELVDPRQGLATADNNRFLRQWFEVAQAHIKFDATSLSDAIASGKKWFPYNKGGAYRKWYGNYDYVVNWQNDGREIKNFKDANGKVRSRPQNTNFYFREAITWSDVNSGHFSLRYRNAGSIHDVKGMSAFKVSADNNFYAILALLNSPIGDYIFNMLNPTISLQVGNFKTFPVLSIPTFARSTVNQRAKASIALAEKDWDSFETSWDFTTLPMLAHIAEHTRLKLQNAPYS